MSSNRPFDEQMMRRALELAGRGLGRVEPNPLVGAVVVDPKGTILGEGWHEYYGGPHAEVRALEGLGTAASGATLYVTLEPCCHFGKTPPCSQAVIAAGIRRVVTAMRDPNPRVDGGGIQELLNAGVQVETGILEHEARRLVAPFMMLMTQQRPWFLAKWAMTLDGKIATRTGHSKWISNERSRNVVHELRGRMDGILVGAGTALADDPSLTARPAGPRQAVRIVIDSAARLPLTSQLVSTASEVPVLLFATRKAAPERCEQLSEAGVEVVVVSEDSRQHCDVTAVAAELGRRRMTNVLIEGGSGIHGAFFEHQLIDELHAFISPKLVGGTQALTPIGGRGIDFVPELASLESPSVELLDGDVYIHGLLKKACP